MADPREVVPYDDPDDAAFAENILRFLDESNPTLEDLPPPQPLSRQPGSVEVGSVSNPNTGAGSSGADPSEFRAGTSSRKRAHVETESSREGRPLPTWPPEPMPRSVEFVGFSDPNTGAGSSGAGPSEFRAETSSRKQAHVETDSSREGRPLQTWPPDPIPFNCSCCQVLREIIYTNGINTIKLEIHGRLGMICHAILANMQNVFENSSSSQYHMFDFCKKSINDVKQFLVNFCFEQRIAGYLMVQDPLSTFYEAVCVGLDWDKGPLPDDLFQLSPTNSVQMSEGSADQEIEVEDGDGYRKVSLAEQRERAASLRLSDVGRFFHLPIEEAARKLKLCPTVVKKICRREEMNRWPYRKVKSIQKQIASLRPSLESNNAETRANAQAEIERLQQELLDVCGGVPIHEE